MTADVELLPLPEWTNGNNHLRIKAAGLQTRVTDYARANVAHATAAKDAEIEALKSDLGDYMDAANYQAARAERLEEALRDALECGNDGDWQSARQYITAALRDHDQEVGNG